MPKFTVEIDDVEEKALLIRIVSIQEWLSNFIHNEARQCMDTLFEKLSIEDRYTIVRNAQVKSAAERNTKLEAELSAESPKTK